MEGNLEPFDPETLHNAGMVFEPVNSFSDAKQAAERRFEEQVRAKAKLDRLAQVFIRTLRQRFGLVYHPLWVIRYLYRQRSFQVVVDGYSGLVLYGKAPGNTLYRAGVLVLGMAVGALIAIDVPAVLLAASDSDSSGLLLFALGAFVVGLGIMAAAYRAFRYGEQYEYHHGGKDSAFAMPDLDNPMEMITQVKDVEEWIKQLT